MGSGTRPAAGRLKRITGAPYARAAAVALLAAAALGQAIAQAVTLSGGGSARAAGPSAVLAAEYVLPLSLLALLATVPLAVYRPAAAAAAVTFGNAVALFSFGQLTAGGAVAELAAAGWLGLAGGLPLAGARGPAGRPGGAWLKTAGGTTPGRYLALALAIPFAASAVAGGGWPAVLLAAAVPAAAGAGIAVWAGRLARTRSATGEALADTLLAHTARGERARIARELHDVVAHHISMIAVLSETGRLATPGLPEAGARRFAEIGDTARAGLTEMRRLLGVLREDAALPASGDGPDAPDGTGRQSAGADQAEAADRAVPAEPPARPAGRASRQPQPGLGQLTELVDAARDASAAGTRLIISGPVAPLDPGVELAAYRIIQEALTNARRHAPGAAVDVELRYSPGSLRLRVRDNGPGPTAGSGHGLAGMGERAFSAGGSLYAGLAPGGGFLVEAVLPAGQGPTVSPAGPGSSGLAGAGR